MVGNYLFLTSYKIIQKYFAGLHTIKFSARRESIDPITQLPKFYIQLNILPRKNR